MGVHGLWKLLEPSGKPVPVETLENHVLAVDVSIWLHQLLQGYREAGGSSLPNAHLLGLFHRVCKLLYFRIKPVFVFDGGVPALKKKTIAARHQQKDRATIASEKARQQLLKNLLKQKAVSQVLGELNAVPSTSSASKEKKDLYELPPIVNEDDNSDLESVHDSYSSESEEDLKKKKKYKDLHSIDVHSSEFKSLPADIRHDILSELKEKRKESSWGRIHEMPEDLGQFSNFQMNRLLKRRSVQVSLEEAEKEMGGRTLSLGDVEALLTEQGIQTSNVGTRIASDNVTRFLYISESAKEEEKNVGSVASEKNGGSLLAERNDPKNDSSEDNFNNIKNNEEKYKRILSPVEESNESNQSEPVPKFRKEFTNVPIFDEIKVEGSESSSDEITFEELNEEFEMNRKLIIENSGLTQDQIFSIIKEQNKKSNDNCNKICETVENSDIKNNISIKDKESTSSGGSSSSCQKLSLQEISRDVNSSPEIGVQHSLAKDSNVASSIKDTNISECKNNETENSQLADSDKGDKKILSESNYSINHGKSVKMEDKYIGDKKYTQSINQKTNSSSDSCSDDEFDEVVQPAKKINTETEVKPTNPTVLQVTINTKPDEKNNDEDIFADIFEAEDKDEGVLDFEKSASNKNDVEIMSSSDTSTSESEGDTTKSVSVHDEIVTSANDESNIMPEKSSQYFESLEMKDEKEVTKEEENVAESGPKEANDCNTVGMDESSVIENNQNSKIDDENHSESSKKPTKKLTTKELSKLQTILEQQEGELLLKQGKEERLASTVTEQMRLEAQELLQLFGVPWVMAPMEAEAQCAFLDLMGLTQGTITDDSDIWLFGARKVYKNFFNQKKFVLQFQAQDIQHYFKLSRGDLIELALLVGSDYTTGVTGVGPVTALEIIAMFRPSSSNDSSVLKTLTAFKSWLQHPNNSTSPLARKLKDVHLDEGFPSKDVVEAYLHPLVDESDETFSWGFPDLDGLREFTKRKFGWSQARTDEILLPVIKRLSEKTSQSKIDSYFHIKPAIPVYKDKVSQRVQKAIYRLGGQSDSVIGQFESGASSSSQIQRQRRSRGASQSRRVSGRGRGRGTALEIEPPPPPKPLPFPANEELIPQRERDRLEALKRKMQAIEVMKAKKSKNVKKRPPRALIKPEANLSESSSDEN